MTASVCQRNMANQTKRSEEILKSDTKGTIANYIHGSVCEVKTREALVCVEGENIRKQTDEVNKCARSRARTCAYRSAVVNTEHA